MAIALPQLDDAFPVVDGYPRPRWDLIWHRIRETVPEGRQPEAAAAVERLWLERLARHLGGGYVTAESARFLLLSEHAPADRDAFLAAAEGALTVVEDSLELPPDPDAAGKVPVIVFSEDDDYYDYISHYFADGHYGLTAGVCIREGDVHLVLRCPEDFLWRTFAHELTHGCLAHLDLPVWLEEGVCEVVSRRYADEAPLDFGSEVRDRHYAFWSWHGLDAFWVGTSFSRPDELQSLSYALAEALVRQVNAREPSRFGQYLLTARASDGGESAARECFGVSLVAFVAQMLGEGPWLPPPTDPAVVGE